MNSTNHIRQVTYHFTELFVNITVETQAKALCLSAKNAKPTLKFVQYQTLATKE